MLAKAGTQGQPTLRLRPLFKPGRALGPRLRGGDGKEKIGPISLVRTTSCFWRTGNPGSG